MSYVTRAIIEGRRNDPRYHSDACLSHSVNAFCDGLPEPGCICDGDATIARLNAADLADLRDRTPQD